MKNKKTSKTPRKTLRIILCLLFAPSMVLAAGKAPISPPPSPPEGSGSTTPNPVRPIRLQEVGTKAFVLPNGNRVDLSADFEAILVTSVSHTENLAPTDPIVSPAPCEETLELRASVSTLELNVAELGFSFGYTPGGELGPITDINGEVGVRVGTIAMDFSIWRCRDGRCTAVAASHSDQSIAEGGLTFRIDFGLITTGPSLMAKTPLGNVIRKIMLDGVSKIARSPRIPELAWHARVLEASSDTGVLYFNAGVQERIGPQQSFIVYSQSESDPESLCGVYKAIAEIVTVSVTAISSKALVSKTLDSTEIRAGDIVMIHQSF